MMDKGGVEVICKNSEYCCPISTALDLIGGKYKALILWHLTDSTLRFGELQRLISQATPKMLSQQLRELERAEIVIRTVYPTVPPKVEYSLTDLGKSMKPILDIMYSWGAEYLLSIGKEANCSMSTFD